MAQERTQRIGNRIRALRKRHGLYQEDLAERLGFNNRQTLSALERGERRVKPAELAAAAEIFDVNVDFFTDPFRFVADDECRFSFRVEPWAAENLDDFQEKAGRWIATYRWLSESAGVGPDFLARKLELQKSSSYEDAQACAEALRYELLLGGRPAIGLEDALTKRLNVIILHVDAPPGVSGAASYLPGQRTILVNRHESVGRRKFDIAHELFHLLTWDAMPPKRVEEKREFGSRGDRVEQLANNFAAALLMPKETVQEFWSSRNGGEIHQWLNSRANQLSVSSLALMWRLYNLGHLSRREMEAVDQERLAANGEGVVHQEAKPRPFNRTFVAWLQSAINDGRLSLRKAAELLDVSPEQLADLCDAYDLALPYDV